MKLYLSLFVALVLASGAVGYQRLRVARQQAFFARAELPENLFQKLPQSSKPEIIRAKVFFSSLGHSAKYADFRIKSFAELRKELHNSKYVELSDRDQDRKDAISFLEEENQLKNPGLVLKRGGDLDVYQYYIVEDKSNDRKGPGFYLIEVFMHY